MKKILFGLKAKKRNLTVHCNDVYIPIIQSSIISHNTKLTNFHSTLYSDIVERFSEYFHDINANAFRTSIK